MSCPGAGTASTGVELAMSWKMSCTQYVCVCGRLPELIITKYVLLTGGRAARAAAVAAVLTFNKAPSCCGVY